MKKPNPFFIFMLFTIATNLCYSQSDTIFFDAAWKTSTRENAKYYRLVTKKGSAYLVKDIYINNNSPQMIALCTSVDPIVKEGKCTFYFENGMKKSEGEYSNDKLTGTWIWWDDDGKDSSISKYKSDGTYKWIRETKQRKDKPLMFVEQMPVFPGGDKELSKFLIKNIKYPKEANKNHIEGTVVLQFVVESDGTIDNIKILRSVAGGCTEESVRVIKMMPRWKPGKQNGDAVAVYFNLPITFSLSEDDVKKK